MAVDRDAIPHPRERSDLVGHAAAEATVAAALAGGRFPHAWLIGGPEGIGKATLAYQVARRLLAPPAEWEAGLGVAATGRTARQVASRSHPNMVVLERPEAEDGKAAPRTIDVKAVRKALTFFGTTAADGGRRICLVDPVEDLNTHGLNALLKTMEEPPAGGVVLLVSHAPRQVLPTVRSRCRKLDLAPLRPEEVEAVLAGLVPHLPHDEGARAAAASEGSVRRALTLLEPKRAALVADLTALLSGLPALPMARILAMGERLADRKAEGDLAVALDTVTAWVAERIRERAGEGPRRLAPLAEVCEKLRDRARTVEIYNLDRRTLVIETFGDLAEAVRLAA